MEESSRPIGWTIWAWLLGYLVVVNLPTEPMLRVGVAVYLGALLLHGLRRPRDLFLVWLALVPLRSRLLAPWRVSAIDLSFDRMLLASALLVWLLWEIRHLRGSGWRSTWGALALVAVAFADIEADLLGDGALGPSLRHSSIILIEVIGIPLLYQRLFSRRDLPALVEAFGAGAVALGACAVVERFGGLNPLLRFPTSFAAYRQLQDAVIVRDGVLRVRGPFTNPVYLGGFVPLVMFAGVYLAVLRQRRLLGMLVLGAGMAAAALCVSRTAVYAVAVFLLPAAFVLLRRLVQLRVNRLGLSLGLTAGLLAAIYLAPDLARSLQMGMRPTAETYEGANATSRFTLLAEGLPVVAGNNPFGIGFDESARQRRQQLGEDIASFYVGYGLTKGWVWLVVFLAAVGIIGGRLLAADLTGLLLAALLMSLLASYFSFAEFWITFPVFLTFALVAERRGLPGRAADVGP